MSLRIDSCSSAAAAVAAAVVFASVIVYFVVRGELYGPIDTGLRTRGDAGSTSRGSPL